MSFEEKKDSISDVVRSFRKSRNALWAEVLATRRDKTIPAKERKKLLEELYSPLSVKDIKSQFAMDLIDHQIGVSFRSSISQIRHWKEALRKHGAVISPGGNLKEQDQEFARRLGINTPRIIEEGKRVFDIELRPNCVLKPASGSAAKGVFYIDSNLKLWSFATKQSYDTLDEALDELNSAKRIQAPNWKLEEAIERASGEPAHDFKVWQFYGVPGVIQEIKRNPLEGTPNEYFYYRPDGSEFPMNSARRKLEPSGIPRGLLDAAEKVSLASPVPFMRVDFLVGAEDFYLGEITPHPGGAYAGQIFDEADKELGSLYYDACARLYLDLMKGKDFTEYLETYRVEI